MIIPSESDLTPAQFDLLRRANLASLSGLDGTARALLAIARREFPSLGVPATTDRRTGPAVGVWPDSSFRPAA